jgi:hypothetical protein
MRETKRFMALSQQCLIPIDQYMNNFKELTPARISG